MSSLLLRVTIRDAYDSGTYEFWPQPEEEVTFEVREGALFIMKRNPTIVNWTPIRVYAAGVWGDIEVSNEH